MFKAGLKGQTRLQLEKSAVKEMETHKLLDSLINDAAFNCRYKATHQTVRGIKKPNLIKKFMHCLLQQFYTAGRSLCNVSVTVRLSKWWPVLQLGLDNIISCNIP